MCYPAEFGRSSSNGTSVINEKFDTRVPPFMVTQGRSLIRTDTYRSATYDFY